ncbi:MAG: MltA domain-containing protein [Methylococcaceae bacterium]|nr:MltA domain-containing protein [Methylococcaceae bacterium]
MKLNTMRYTALLALLLLAGCSETPIVDQPTIVYPHPPTNLPTKPPIAINQPTYNKAIAVPPVITGAPISTRVGNVQLHPSDFNVLPGWTTEDHAAAFKSFQNSCKRWQKMPADKVMSGAFNLGCIADWQRVCSMPVTRGQERQFFEKWFKPYAVSENGLFDGMFTGYYLPELHGSYTRSARYDVPIYRMPSGGLRNYSRAQIKAGALENKGLELLWVDNDIDAFFMEVQGSGRVVMEDGSIIGLGFAGGNGHAYYAIGKTLVNNGEISKEDISMQTIRAWIEQHPVEGEQLMLSNSSYVYFRFTPVDPNIGPAGAMAVPLTAKHSLAIDHKNLPYGIPIWLDAEHPVQGQRLQCLVMAQDTGGAIKGVIRGDVYWGQGEKASQMAGPMKSKGYYFLLVPRSL